MSEFNYTFDDEGKVTNPFSMSDVDATAYPPKHHFQDWEVWNADSDWSTSDMINYTYQSEWHAVYTIQLGELLASGVFDWKRDELNWADAAYSEEQFSRFCAYFESRFAFREISILPIKEWFNALKRMLVYELMPKYTPMYESIEDGISALASENEYKKSRHITSDYPETLLSGNADYISDGADEEFERVKIGNVGDAIENFKEKFASVDKMIADELEILFISLYTVNVNGF